MSWTPEDAERWEGLVEREVFGEALDEDDRAFLARYEAAHSACARERELWERAGRVLDERPSDEQLADAALARYRAEARPAALATSPPPRPAPRRAGVTAGLGAVALAAAAAGLALWLRAPATPGPEAGAERARRSQARPRPQPPSSERPQAAAVTPVEARARLSLAGPSAPALGAAFAPGESLSLAEPTCVSWTEPAAVVCFEGALALSTGEDRGERRLRLDEGRLVAALDPLGPGQRFTVETHMGQATAVGTVFAVEIHEGRVWVTVLEGRVELRDGSLRTLEAGQRTSLRKEVAGDEPSPTLATPTALEHLEHLATWLRAHPDEPPPGETLEPGVEPGAELALAPTPAATSKAPARKARRSVPSAKRLASEAQRERSAGHHAETARLYQLLLEHYPDSPEAVNVPVRLGDLLLASGDHTGALAAYERYIQGGAKLLLPEAEFGRIQALRALGRQAELSEAIAAFRAAHPRDYRVESLVE